MLKTIEMNKRLINTIAEELLKKTSTTASFESLPDAVFDYLDECDTSGPVAFMEGVPLIGILHLVNIDLLRVAETN